MTTHPDRVGTAQRVLDVWRAELAPRTVRWSLLVSSAELELSHDADRMVEADGSLATLLARQAVDAALPAEVVAETLTHCARAVRPVGGLPSPVELAAAVRLLGGAEAVNDRLRRAGLRTRVAADGTGLLAPSEQAEAMAALAGNPAYDVALPSFVADAPLGLAAYLVADVSFWHAQGAGPTTRHDGGVLVTPDGADLGVHVHTEVPPSGPPTLDDPVLAAIGRAMARTVALLGHPELTLPL